MINFVSQYTKDWRIADYALFLCADVCVCVWIQLTYNFYTWLRWLIGWLDRLDDLTIFSICSVHIYIQAVHDFTLHIIYTCACVNGCLYQGTEVTNDRTNEWTIFLCIFTVDVVVAGISINYYFFVFFSMKCYVFYNFCCLFTATYTDFFLFCWFGCFGRNDYFLCMYDLCDWLL